MVIKLTGTPSVKLHTEGNVLESLNTHHSPGMKYVDLNLIIYIIKSAQQFPGSAPWTAEGMWCSPTASTYIDAEQERHLFGSFVTLLPSHLCVKWFFIRKHSEAFQKWESGQKVEVSD